MTDAHTQHPDSSMIHDFLLLKLTLRQVRSGPKVHRTQYCSIPRLNATWFPPIQLDQKPVLLRTERTRKNKHKSNFIIFLLPDV